MTEFRQVTDSLAEIVAKTGIVYPNPYPYEDCTLAMVLWNEAARLPDLLVYLRPFFKHIAICVQKSDDDTLAIAQTYASTPDDRVFEDEHRGYGEASLPILLDAIKTPWVFSLAGDEKPDTDLLTSLASAMAYAALVKSDAVWVRFESWVEDVEYTEQHGHLRLFRKHVGWSNNLHSRPMSNRGIWWPTGYIAHRRSLDEMMQDYLRYYKIGRGNAGWVIHNTLMMHDACVSVAAKHGWEFVRSFDWWPEVAKIAFRTGVPDG